MLPHSACHNKVLWCTEGTFARRRSLIKVAERQTTHWCVHYRVLQHQWRYQVHQDLHIKLTTRVSKILRNIVSMV